MANKKSAADDLYRMFSFQYKGIETIIKQGRVKNLTWQQYQKMSSAGKISVCDNLARQIGL